MLSQQVHAVPCIRNSHFHGVIGNNAWGRCICLTQSCNRNSYYPCQRMWNSSTDNSEYQPKKREKLPWTESKLTQTGVAFFSNVFKAMKFYTSVIIYLWKKYTFHSYLLWGYLWNSFMVLSHPDQIKPTKILKHFLSNLHKELISKKIMRQIENSTIKQTSLLIWRKHEKQPNQIACGQQQTIVKTTACSAYSKPASDVE